MEKYEVALNQRINNMLTSAIRLVDGYVSKTDLINLSDCDVEDISERLENSIGIDFFKLDRLAYNPEEGIIDKLVNVYSAMHSMSSTVLIVIKGNSDGTSDYYFGCRNNSNPGVAAEVLRNNLSGNFPGIVLEKQKKSQKDSLLDECFPLEYSRKSIASVSVSADYRRNKAEEVKTYFQGVEKFIETMRGYSYTALFIAEPVGSEDCKERRIAIENMMTELSKYKTVNIAYNEGESIAINESFANSFTDTISDSLSHSVSSNISKSIGKTKGHNYGGSSDFFTWHSNHGSSSAKTTTSTSGEGESDTTSKSRSYSNGSTLTKGQTSTVNAGINMTLSFENKRVADLGERLEYELDKLENADSFGMWDTAVYVISDSEDVSVMASNSVRSLFLGDESGKTESYINYWSGDFRTYNLGDAGKIMKFLHYGMHPVFKSRMTGEGGLNYYLTPAVPIGGNVLPAIMGFPLKSVPGITVFEMAEFGRNIVKDNIVEDGKRKISLGNIMYMGHSDNTPVELTVNSLSGHTFICGSPGSGKSNATAKLITELLELNRKPERDEGYGEVRFLVIEPAKGEYKFDYGNLGGLNIFTSRDDMCRLLKINPFEFPFESMDITAHIDHLMNILSVCWPLTAAMPAILKDALQSAYVMKGWDLRNSRFILPGNVKFPSFQDVLTVLPKIINSSAYSSDAKGDYTGALVTRVKSLVTGITGKIFDNVGTVSDEVLFDENTIIDLSDIGSGDTISLIMGVLIDKLQNYRKYNATRANYPLRHVTVLEEAHNILPSNSEGSSEGVNIRAESVKSISKAISEMRTYGEGFFIIDQSPAAVSDIAISYTSTKIVMRLPGQDDIDVAGASLGLTQAQKSQIPMLPQGQAIVKQGDWLKPIVVHIDKASNKYHRKHMEEYLYEDLMKLRGDMLKESFSMIRRNEKRNIFMSMDVKKVLKVIDDALVSEHNKIYLKEQWTEFCSLSASKRKEELPLYVIKVSEFEGGLLACSYVFEEDKQTKIKGHLFNKMVKEWADFLKNILTSQYVAASEETIEDILSYIYAYCASYSSNEIFKNYGMTMLLRNKR